jgi:hypothetical protein
MPLISAREGAVRIERVSADVFGGRVKQHAVYYFGFADKGVSVPIDCDRTVDGDNPSGEAQEVPFEGVSEACVCIGALEPATVVICRGRTRRHSEKRDNCDDNGSKLFQIWHSHFLPPL